MFTFSCHADSAYSLLSHLFPQQLWVMSFVAFLQSFLGQTNCIVYKKCKDRQQTPPVLGKELLSQK